jgi:hypothetical protein
MWQADNTKKAVEGQQSHCHGKAAMHALAIATGVADWTKGKEQLEQSLKTGTGQSHLPSRA